MFVKNETKIWAEILDTGDFPHNYFVTFGAIVYTAVFLILPWFLATPISTMLAKGILGDGEES